MKYPEYDSPFELTISDIATQVARDIDKMALKAVQKVGISVDKDKLLAALKQDAERYREAYAHGYDTGYEKRDEEIVRCNNCKWLSKKGICKHPDGGAGNIRPENWFCADGEEREAE
jgi:hypothetical protein